MSIYTTTLASAVATLPSVCTSRPETRPAGVATADVMPTWRDLSHVSDRRSTTVHNFIAPAAGNGNVRAGVVAGIGANAAKQAVPPRGVPR